MNKPSPEPRPARYFSSAADFRAWLAAQGAQGGELWVGFWKVGSGQPSLSWSESVDEALCFGWIDGLRQRVDEQRYRIRFTPRRPGSIWSAVNLAKVEALLAAGRMQESGLAAYAARDAARCRVYSFEREHPAQLSADELARFAAHPEAWAYYQACPPSYLKAIQHWVASAKRVATRERRLTQLIEACAQGQRLA